MPADLHLHSSASDGTILPREIVKLAYKNKLSTISITDHDTIKGINDAINEASDLIEVIPGIEIGSNFNDKEVHILGYFINHEYTELNKKLSEFNKERITRAEKILALLEKENINIKLKDLLDKANPAYPGRAHIARLMIEKGYVNNFNEAFERYLKKDRSCYVSKMGAGVEESISIINRAGGIASLAHPSASFIKEEEIALFKNNGLEGLEVYHPKHSSKEISMYKDMCKNLGLLITGGSDSHGNNGTMSFNKIDNEYVERLKELLNNKLL